MEDIITVENLATGDQITRIRNDFYTIVTPKGNKYQIDLKAGECTCKGFFYNKNCRHLKSPKIAVAKIIFRWICPYCGNVLENNGKWHWRTGKKTCPNCGKKMLIGIGKKC